MKKIFTLACVAAMAISANAQSTFNVAPDYYMFNESEGTELLLLGEKMSTNALYVSGQDLQTQCPFVWNTQTDDIFLLKITDTIYEAIDWDEMGNPIAWDTSYGQDIDRSGSFRAVNANGQAVGCTVHQGSFFSYPVMYDFKTGQTYDLKFDDTKESGAEGYAITDDGSKIAGFYYDSSWNATPCIWTENGAVRTDLPTPTEEDLDFPVDYTSCRSMTPDGKTLLGYVQDFYSGDWVTVLWHLQEDGTYKIDTSLAQTLYQTRAYDEYEDEDGWPVVVYRPIENPKPFAKLEPLCISDNGEWLVAVAHEFNPEEIDDETGNYFAAQNCIRYNLKTGKYDMMPAGDETARIEFFGIADDGTAAGRFTGPVDWATLSQPTDAVVWLPGTSEMIKVVDLFPEDAYTEGWAVSALSHISADGKKIMGYAEDEMGYQTTFVVDLSNATGINSVLAGKPAVSVTYDLNGRRVQKAQDGMFVVNGKKVVK